MKKQILTIALAFTSVMALNAQEMSLTSEDGSGGNSGAISSKKGMSILPESGDMAVGIDAVPFLNFMGNSLNNSTNNTVFNNFTTNNQTIYGKYFLSDASAVRARIRIGYNNAVDKNLVDDNDDPDPEKFVEDKRAISAMQVVLGGGYEMRRGKGRVQGYYGGEAVFGYGSGKTKYTYANEYRPANTTPTTTDNFDQGTTFQAASRTLETKQGNTIMFGARGFFGAEYFFAPKMSIGAEFGWGLNFSTTGNGESTSEGWTGTEAEEVTTETANGRDINLDTDNASGAIVLMLHF